MNLHTLVTTETEWNGNETQYIDDIWSRNANQGIMQYWEPIFEKRKVNFVI